MIKEKKIKVLLIDDDPEDVGLIQEVLTRVNGHGPAFDLKTAGNLEAGLTCLEEKSMDIVLLDLQLPDSKGIETFNRISERAPDIPIIILSVIYDDALAMEALRRGAQDYLFKREANHEVLVRTIHFAVERHRLRKDLAGANARLEKLSLLDPVTELFNRRGLQEILSREIRRIQNKSSSLLALLIDLDDFKKMNSALGHKAGDVILREVAAKLQSVLRPTDYSGRPGGDEFVVLMPETHFAEGMRIAEKIRLAVSTTRISVSSFEDICMTASIVMINASNVDPHESGGNLDDMITRMRQTLTKAKPRSKNKLYFEEIASFENNLEEIPDQLGDATKYSVLGQPIFDLIERKEVGYELLSRSVIKGFESPDDFFRAALEANMLVKVDYQCLRHCLEAAQLLPEGLQYHFNLYPATLINLPVDNLLALFSRYKSKNSYTIEISEQQIIGDPAYLLESVSALKRAGISVAIDDLGFGRSCLESLILLEPDIVKIDKKCVTGINEDDQTPMKSLKRLVKMARSLGAEVIAEGIETQKDLEMLKSLGVKFGQGFLWGKPKIVSHVKKTFLKSKK